MMDVSLAEIIDRMPGIVDLYDVAGDRILWISAGFQRLTGYSVAEVERIGYCAIVLPDDRQAVLDSIAELAASDHPTSKHLQYRIITKSRTVLWFSSEKSRLIWQDKVLIISITTDCTAQQVESYQQIEEIRQALGREEFKLHLQPIVWLQDFSVVGAEALTRWHRGDGRIDKPGTFMPTIEREAGLSKRFCIYVLSHAYQILELYPHRFLSINISPVLLEQNGFFGFACSALPTGKVSPGRLILEITETLSAQNLQALGLLVEQLRDAGILTLLDDFGTGHNSLKNLIYLQAVAKIKIDQQFTQGIQNPRVSAIVRNIVKLAHELKIQTVAEGIETAEQAITMRDMGCDFGQGYFFGKPARSPEL